MDAKLINEIILSGYEVEVWRTYEPRFGRGSRLAEEKMGEGRIVRQVKGFIVLDDGEHYPLEDTEIRLKQK